MSPEITLFILRVIAALSLLMFMGLIAWLIYKDIKVITESRESSGQKTGLLDVIGDESSPIPEGTSLPMLPVTSIGRSPSNTIVIDDDYVSNHHVLIALRGNNWWVEDLGSRNGTELNDIPLEVATVVSEGDIISIGHTRLRIKL